jgi:hypothetical protein
MKTTCAGMGPAQVPVMLICRGIFMKLIHAACRLAATQALLTVLTAHAQAPSAPTDQAGFWGQPIAIDQLASQRGGASISRSELMLSGATADNSATNVVTGSNAIAAGSFANMSGLPLVVQNSGANVLIQNAVIIHVQMQ